MAGPPCGVIKVNCDASIDKSRKTMGMDIIVINVINRYEGNVYGKTCSSKSFSIDPTIAEVYAV